jgi:hypothetical protein
MRRFQYSNGPAPRIAKRVTSERHTQRAVRVQMARVIGSTKTAIASHSVQHASLEAWPRKILIAKRHRIDLHMDV